MTESGEPRRRVAPGSDRFALRWQICAYTGGNIQYSPPMMNGAVTYMAVLP
jgi:hypothetical protein